MDFHVLTHDTTATAIATTYRILAPCGRAGRGPGELVGAIVNGWILLQRAATLLGGLLRLNMEYKYGGIGEGVVDIKNHREYKCRAI